MDPPDIFSGSLEFSVCNKMNLRNENSNCFEIENYNLLFSSFYFTKLIPSENVLLVVGHSQCSTWYTFVAMVFDSTI